MCHPGGSRWWRALPHRIRCIRLAGFMSVLHFLSTLHTGIDPMHQKVDAAAELGIPNLPLGEPGSQESIPVLSRLVATKAEELLGLTQVTPLKDVVAESVEDFRVRGYPGFTT
jgi:hypothetical protein